jgi:hypothetical protein
MQSRGDSRQRQTHEGNRFRLNSPRLKADIPDDSWLEMRAQGLGREPGKRDLVEQTRDSNAVAPHQLSTTER